MHLDSRDEGVVDARPFYILQIEAKTYSDLYNN